MTDWSKPAKNVLEKDIEREGMDYAVSRGWFECKFVAPGCKGIPDRFMARAGRVMLVEWKKDREEPTTQQLLRHEELRNHGVEVHWFDNLEAARTIFR
jgi:hypothetical protein